MWVCFFFFKWRSHNWHNWFSPARKKTTNHLSKLWNEIAAKTLGEVSSCGGDTAVPKRTAGQQPWAPRLTSVCQAPTGAAGLELQPPAKRAALLQWKMTTALGWDLLAKRSCITSCGRFVCATAELFCVKTRLSIRNYMFYNKSLAYAHG